MMLRQILLICFLFSPALFAEQVVEVENKTYWLCKNRKEVRTIRVHIENGGRCKTIYSKLGSEKVIGSGLNLQSCMNFQDNVKGNLEKSNWTCRDISATRITAGAE